MYNYPPHNSCNWCPPVALQADRSDLNIAASNGDVTLQDKTGSITVDDLLGIQALVAEFTPVKDKLQVVVGDVGELKASVFCAE